MFVCLWRAGGKAGGVCYHNNSNLRASIFTKLDLHFQLIKFWLACAPGKGSAAGGGEFGSALLQPSRTLCVYGGTAAGAQCLRLSERFFIPTVFNSNFYSTADFQIFPKHSSFKTVNYDTSSI